MANLVNRRAMLATWKSEAEAQLARVVRKLQPLEAQKQELEVKIEAIATLIEFERVPSEDQEGSRKLYLADQIYSVLVKERNSMHYRDILAILQAQGTDVTGSDPLKTMRSYLSRDDRFVSVGKGYYRLAQAVAEQDDAANEQTQTESDMEYDPFADDNEGGGVDNSLSKNDMDYDPFAEE